MISWNDDLGVAGGGHTVAANDQRRRSGRPARLYEWRDEDFVEEAEQEDDDDDQTHTEAEQERLQVVLGFQGTAGCDFVTECMLDVLRAARIPETYVRLRRRTAASSSSYCGRSPGRARPFLPGVELPGWRRTPATRHVFRDLGALRNRHAIRSG